MKVLKNNLPLILFVLFELTVGILLLVNPEAFTRMIIISFGIVMLIIGIIYLVRSIKEKKEKHFPLFNLIISIFSLILGAVCALGTSFIMDLFSVIAIIYGVVMIVSGIYKLQNYFQSKKLDKSVLIITLIGAVISIILGIIIVANPFKTTVILWRFAGISLLAEAVVDFTAIVFLFKAEQRIAEEINSDD